MGDQFAAQTILVRAGRPTGAMVRPTWDVDGSMADDDVAVIDVDAALADDERAATAAVLAARCHVVLLAGGGDGGPPVADRIEHLRGVLTGRVATRGAAGRRRVERALTAARTGRTGQIAQHDLATLIEDLRVLEASLRSSADARRTAAAGH